MLKFIIKAAHDDSNAFTHQFYRILWFTDDGIDPINFMVSPEMLSSNKENVEALRESLGLNDPLIVQYFRWLGNCLKRRSWIFL